MATLATDHDGKSKTASASDAKHYPEQHEVPQEHHEAPPQHKVASNGGEHASHSSEDGPSHEQIQARAYELWCERGCPHGSAEHDWHQAEQELKTQSGSERISDQEHQGTGSVQR